MGGTVLIPALWALHSLVLAAFSGLNSLVPEQIQQLAEKLLRGSPNLARALNYVSHILQVSGISAHATDFLTTLAKTFIGGSLRSIGHSLLMLFVIFFLLRDGPLFIRGIKQLIPLSESDTSRLLTRIVDTIHATVLGMIAVAVLQGALGAILLWWLNISNIAVWGTIMALLALVPYLGTFVVWIPIAASLVMQGDWLNTCITIIWGSLVIGLSDNVIYPYLVGQRLHYHSLIVFFFLLGGILAFGAAGAVLGPIILAITERLLWIRSHSQTAINSKDKKKEPLSHGS